MAQMNVGMSLTLADGASGPLRAFVSLVEQLGVVASGVAAKLTSVAQGITGINSAASGAGAVTALSGALGALSTEATGARTATTGLEASLAALGASLTGVTAQLSATLATMAALGAQATATGAEMRLGTANMGAGLATANTQASGLLTTLKGLAEVYVGLKIEKGLTGAAEEAIGYQTTQTRLKNMGVSASDRAALIGSADAASRAIPQFNKDQTLEIGIDLRTATGSVEHAMEMLEPVAKALYNMKLATPAGKSFDMTGTAQDFAKYLEARNATLDPVKMQAEIDALSQITTGTQGRVNASMMLGNTQQSRGVAGSMDIDQLPQFAAFIQEMKAGGTGGVAGTMLATMDRYVLGVVKNGTSAKTAVDLGLIDRDNVKWNNQGNVDLKKSDLTMSGAKDFLNRPFDWIKNTLEPALKQAGIDLADDAAVQQVLAKLFPDRRGSDFARIAISRGQLIDKEAGNIRGTEKNDEQYQNNIETAQANIDAFKAQMANLGIVLGTTLLPAITSIAKAFTDAFEYLAGFFADHPIAAQFATWGAAIVGVGIAITGLISLFGFAALGAGALGITMTGMAAAGATALAAIGAALGPLTVAVAVFFAAWEFGTWLANLEVGGQQVRTWGAELIEDLVGIFEKGWAKISGFLVKIGNAAAVIPGMQSLQFLAGAGETAPAFHAADNYGTRAARSVEQPSFGAIDFGAGDGWGGKPKAGGRARAAGGGGGGGGGGGRTRASTYNPDADIAGNEFKREEDALRNSIKSLDLVYKRGTTSVNEYYEEKQGILDMAVSAEVATLNRERVAFLAAGNTAGVNRVDTKLEAVQNKFATDSEANETERQERLNKLKKDAVDMERELLMTAGQRRAAEAVHMQEMLAARLKIAVLNKDETGVTQEMADAMLKRSQAAIDLKLRSEELGKIQSDYADKLGEIENAEKNATLSQTAAQDQILALRKEEAKVLDQEIAKQLVLAEAAGDEAAVLKLKKQLRANDAVEGQLPADQIAVLKTTQTAFGNFFNQIAKGGLSFHNLGQAAKGAAQSIADSINSVVSKRLGDALFDSLFGAFFGGQGGGGGGGILGNAGGMFGSFGGSSSGGGLGGWLGSLFGGGATGINAGTVGGSNVSEAGVALGSFASGIDYIPHDMLAMVHEGERVMTKGDNANYTPMQQGKTQINHINISPPAGMSRQSATQLGADISRQLQLADRRNN